MNYEETLSYLYQQLPLFSRTGAAAYKEDITNTVKLCNAIGNPQTKIRTIHIAGTNGKGSTSHMLAAILQQCGYVTGLYTSPHLKDFRERIRINGEMISKDFIVDFVERTKKISEEIEPSFFELTVAMALEYFQEQQVDIAIIETGLGGRLDSTNIILPELSIITNIGYDHMNILGNTLEKIAFEKAGIIKPNTPVVVGETLKETLHIFEEQAEKRQAPIIFAEKAFSIEEVKYTNQQLIVTLKNTDDQLSYSYELDLNGNYQQKNLRTVITAVREIRKLGFNLNEEKVHKALSKVKSLTGLFGRWDVIHLKPLVILDVAHNVDGIKQVLQQIRSSSYRKLHIVIGMVHDKDIDSVLKLLPKIETLYYFTKASIPRAMPENDLQSKAAVYNLKGNTFPEVNVALRNALMNAHEDDIIIVCGSVYLVGEVDSKTSNITAPSGS